MSTSLEALGLSKAEVLELVANKLVESAMREYATDDEGNPYPNPTKFSRVLSQQVAAKVDAAVARAADAYLKPVLAEGLDKFRIPQTNRYGEPQREPMTFIEYLAARADTYLTEMVDHNGKTQQQGGYQCSTSRVAYMVHEHLNFRIKAEMTNALKAANDRIVEGIEATVKAKLAEVSAALKVEVKTR